MNEVSRKTVRIAGRHMAAETVEMLLRRYEREQKAWVKRYRRRYRKLVAGGRRWGIDD